MKMIFRYLNILSFVILLCSGSAYPQRFEPKLAAVKQKTISRVEAMPNEPKPYKMKDWKQTTIEYDKYVYDFTQKGDYLPLIWTENSGRNYKGKTFGLYTAIGDVREGPKKNNGENHEALGAMGSIIGATLVGIDKSKQDGHNYVSMMRNYFNKDNGWNIIMNFTNEGAHIGGGYGNDYWYDVYNNVLFYAIGNYYPKEKDYSEIMHTIADQFYKSDSVLAGNYSYSFFDFKNMKPGKNTIPAQEDVAAGYAFILYAAYLKYGDNKYLKAAKNALSVLEGQKESRFYEALMPFGAYIAAKMNAELGTKYDIQKFLDWTFDGKATNREGWGVIVGNWGGYDVSGIAGSTTDRGGYGFAMNTFDLAWPLTAMVRYDQGYARAVGKWILNASNAARLFYPSDIPDNLQALPTLKAITKNVIAYEGLINHTDIPKFKGVTPLAQGDGPLWAEGMPQETMFSLYGSGHVGFYGGLISTTNVEQILQVNCKATDMFRKYEAYPSLLYYNPYKITKKLSINLGKKKVDVYDAVNRKILKSGASGNFSFEIMSDAARLLVIVPAGSKYTIAGGKLMANGIPIDFRYTN
ncbi:MAG TPA: hypothetical protein VK590_14800 [Saprospiraceae bacterium]|nr:hypothetical protein [Saprospiraceae bacterium]